MAAFLYPGTVNFEETEKHHDDCINYARKSTVQFKFISI